MLRHRFFYLLAPAVFVASSGHCSAGDDVGPLVRSLWLVQRFGTAEAANPRNDEMVKGRLSKALGKEGVLTAAGVQGLMDSSAFEKLAGADGKIDADEMREALDSNLPDTRKSLNPKVSAHADLLTTSLDMIDERHRDAGEMLSDWIAKNYRPGQPLHVTFICTGNSRRSILGATMGNFAAAYYGMPEIRFSSGGTAPTAFNPRTVASLKEIGIEIEPTGTEAPRGEPKTANPVYRVRWGGSGSRLDARGFDEKSGSYLALAKAYIAVHSLHLELHYHSCGREVWRRPEKWASKCPCYGSMVTQRHMIAPEEWLHRDPSIRLIDNRSPRP
jgi:hypothetical protein